MNGEADSSQVLSWISIAKAKRDDIQRFEISLEDLQRCQSGNTIQDAVPGIPVTIKLYGGRSAEMARKIKARRANVRRTKKRKEEKKKNRRARKYKSMKNKNKIINKITRRIPYG